MSIIEIIRKRKSVRSYNGKPLSSEIIDKLNVYINSLSAPFEAEVRIELITTGMDDEPLKLGTYGVISGANNFMALVLKDSPMADVAGGYIFEQLILYCTKLGLATCWLGGTFNSKDFLQQIKIADDEKLTIVSPVGYEREKKKLLDSVMRIAAKSDKRKPFESLFFDSSFDIPLTEEKAGEYRMPLEMLRLAPSASNKQPWRVLKDGSTFHFYHKPNSFSLNDLGIALCHFELTCKEIGIKGMVKVLEDVLPMKDGDYVVSWITE